MPDEDADEVVYELGDWDPDRRVLLANTLDAAGIPHVWETGDLVVNARDEARVEAIIDDVDASGPLDFDDVDDGGDADDDGGAAVDTMGDLFVAADRLMHEPWDASAARDLDEAAQTLAKLATPFGIDGGAWAQIGELAAVVRDDLDAHAAEDVVAADAKALREVLRRFV
jgi:hypothetical protein